MVTTNRLKSVQRFFPKVRVVVDATTNAYIEVTKLDASSKAVKNHKACAMAVACKRKFKLDGVIISRSVAYLIKGTQARRFHLPESVSREVVSFDRGGGFAPGKYELASVPSSMHDPRPRGRDKGDREQAQEIPTRHNKCAECVGWSEAGRRIKGD